MTQVRGNLEGHSLVDNGVNSEKICPCEGEFLRKEWLPGLTGVDLSPGLCGIGLLEMEEIRVWGRVSGMGTEG